MKDRRIEIHFGDRVLEGLLNYSRTADLIWGSLPLDGDCSVWGGEIYFGTPVKSEEEPESSEVVQIGDLAYWPPGQAMCLFFGNTPASNGSEIRAISPVNVIGRIKGSLGFLMEIKGGNQIVVEKISDAL